MKNKRLKILNKFTNKKFLFFGLFVILFINIIIFPFLPRLLHIVIAPENILDIKFGYNKQEVLTVLNNLKTEGRQAYKLFDLFVDMPYLFFYTFYYIVLIYYLLTKKHLNNWFLLTFPFLIGLFDFFENIGILILLKQYPHLNNSTVYFSSLFTMLKWSFALLTVLLALFLYYKKDKKQV